MDDPQFVRAACESCKAPIIWCTVGAGRSAPIDYEPSTAGNVALDDRPGQAPLARVLTVRQLARHTRKGLRTSHFATCPHAGKHRRRDRQS